MKLLILAFTLILSSQLFAQEIKYGDVYRPDEIEKLLQTSFSQLLKPSCLMDYLKSSDYRSRMRDSAKIRSINICSKGRNIRFNIHFNQMGGTQGSIGSMNTIVYCDLKTPLPPAGCNDY